MRLRFGERLPGAVSSLRATTTIAIFTPQSPDLYLRLGPTQLAVARIDRQARQPKPEVRRNRAAAASGFPAACGKPGTPARRRHRAPVQNVGKRLGRLRCATAPRPVILGDRDGNP